MVEYVETLALTSCGEEKSSERRPSSWALIPLFISVLILSFWNIQYFVVCFIFQYMVGTELRFSHDQTEQSSYVEPFLIYCITYAVFSRCSFQIHTCPWYHPTQHIQLVRYTSCVNAYNRHLTCAVLFRLTYLRHLSRACKSHTIQRLHLVRVKKIN